MAQSIIRPKNITDGQWNQALELYYAAKAKGDRYPELTVAQAALETGWFKSPAGKYNYFGQKATSGQQGSTKSTKEVAGGKAYSTAAKFRDYGNINEAIDDRLKKWGKKYQSASNVEEAIGSIWKYNPKTGSGEGHATDTQYGPKLKTILGSMGVATSDTGNTEQAWQQYGVDTSFNLPMNTGDYQTAPELAEAKSKEDLEAEQAKAELTQKQKEKDFIAEIQAKQAQNAGERQQQEEQSQQQQDTGIDQSYYQMPQIALPDYEVPQQIQPQEQFQIGGEKQFANIKPRDEREQSQIVRETLPKIAPQLPQQLANKEVVVPTIDQLMKMRPDLTKDQGIFYGTGDDTTYVSPGGKLGEIVIQNNYKKPKPIIDYKLQKRSEYAEQPVEMSRDAIPELQKFAEVHMAKAMKQKEIFDKKQEVDKGALKIKLSGKALLEDTIENKDIDISKYKTPEQAKKLQKFLVEQGYNLDPNAKFGNRGVDGKIGDVTKQAVTQYNQHLATPGYESVKQGTGLLGKCTEDQCSEYGQNELWRNMQPNVSRKEWNESTGLHGNAWDIGANIQKAGGKEVKTSVGVKPGDVVTMYTGGSSSYQGEANRAGTGTTHTGIIDKVNPDGSYYILHNVHTMDMTGDYEGREYRDLVKNNITGTHNFTVKHVFRPAYDKVGKGEKKVVREDLVLKIDPTKEKRLSEGSYNNFFTSSSAKDKLENTFLKALNDKKNKSTFSKVFNLGDDEYNSLAKISLGILGQEAGFATNPKYTTGYKEAGATVLRGVGYKKDEVSRGAGRMKYKTNFGDDDLTELGITKDTFDDENNVGLVTMYKLAKDYKNFLRKGNNKKDALYKAITVYNSSLGHETNGKTIGEFAKDYDVDYTNKVLNFADMFDVTDNKKSYKTTSDELLLQPNVSKWNTKLKMQNKT